MVTVEHVESRAELVEAMTHRRTAAAQLLRRGHEGKHQSCKDCARMTSLHDDINDLLDAYREAPA